jgi:hypothetical protein
MAAATAAASNTVAAAIDKAVARGKDNAQRLKREFLRQGELGEEKTDEFNEEAMTQGVTIKTFAVVQKSSRVIQLLRSVTKFADAEGPQELSGQVIGFYGDGT